MCCHTRKPIGNSYYPRYSRAFTERIKSLGDRATIEGTVLFMPRLYPRDLRSPRSSLRSIINIHNIYMSLSPGNSRDLWNARNFTTSREYRLTKACGRTERARVELLPAIALIVIIIMRYADQYIVGEIRLSALNRRDYSRALAEVPRETGRRPLRRKSPE